MMNDLTPSLLVLTAVLALAAGTLGGVVGFGSAVILLPLCNFLFGPRAAVPVLTIAALLGNLSRAGVSFREIDWKAVGLYLSGAVPAALAGSILFVKLEAQWLPALFGGFVIASVPARRWAKRNDLTMKAKHLPVLGAAMGFLSAIVSTTGPLNAPFFLSYGLVGGAYLATEALGAAGVHITKALVYGRFQVAETRELVAGLAIGACMIAGSYLGKKLVSRIEPARFIQVVEVLLIVSGAIMIGQAVLALT
ncbi:MAG: sulfite exporter TauE/SafE family protein [Polyangiaceae bacterium]|jgi:uncharacterized membrane protein YfcA|nr:sulfite exporter TauE/SafE family protein [Polyangiaceae bacterium]